VRSSAIFAELTDVTNTETDTQTTAINQVEHVVISILKQKQHHLMNLSPGLPR